MIRIPLRNRSGEIVEHAIIDEDDFERVNITRWHLGKGGYAKNQHGRLNRFIMNAEKDDPKVDHINGNRLDNTKDNLRFVTDSQNAQNRIKKENATSKYFGVSKHTHGTKWTCNTPDKNVYFEIEEHAAYWYDQMALKYYGDKAKINEIDKPDNFEEPIERKNRELPKGITLTEKNKYKVIIKFDYKRVQKTFEKLEEALEFYNSKKEEYNNKKEQELLEKKIERNEDGIAIIQTSKGVNMLVDDNKYHELQKYSLNCNPDGYITSCINGVHMLLHRYIMDAEKNEIVDHINGNRLDNRISNLRKSNESNNSHNRIKKEGCASQYIGVTYEKDRKKYAANITKDKKRYKIGRYDTEEEAARAYDKKAIELYGEFANLNFPLK